MQNKKTRHDRWDKVDYSFINDKRLSKRALFIGINYELEEKYRLKNAINDAEYAMNTLINWGPIEYKILTDHTKIKPIRTEIIKELQWLTHNCSDGDILFLHVSGHAGKIKKNTSFIPLDFRETKTSISSKVFYEILIKNLPAKVTLYVIFDTCHSGSMLKLPFLYLPESNSFYKKPKLKIPKGTIIMLSSCHKTQKTSDTNSLSKWIYNKLSNSEITWIEIIKSLQYFGVNQTPIITTSKPLMFNNKMQAFTKLVSGRKIPWWKKILYG